MSDWNRIYTEWFITSCLNWRSLYRGSQPENLCKHRFHSKQLWNSRWKLKNGIDISCSNFMLMEMHVGAQKLEHFWNLKKSTLKHLKFLNVKMMFLTFQKLQLFNVSIFHIFMCQPTLLPLRNYQNLCQNHSSNFRQPLRIGCMFIWHFWLGMTSDINWC